MVGMHCCTVNGKINSGYYIQSVLALYDHKHAITNEDSHEQMFRDFEDHIDRFTIEPNYDDETGHVTYGFRHKSGKTQWVDSIDIPANLQDMIDERQYRKMYGSRVASPQDMAEMKEYFKASDARKAQEAEEAREARNRFSHDWKSSKGRTWHEDDSSEIDYSEVLEFEKFPNAEDIDFEHLETAFRCTEAYTDSVAELANMAMTIQTLMLENRSDIEATSQLGQNLSYINSNILQTAESGRKITAVVEDQTFLNERETAEKKRAERVRSKRKVKPAVDPDTALAVERLMTKVKAAVDQAQEIPRRKVRVPNVVEEKATEWQAKMFATYSKVKKTPLVVKGAQASSLSPPTVKTSETSQKKVPTKSKSALSTSAKPSRLTKPTPGPITPSMESMLRGSTITLSTDQPESLVTPPQGPSYEDASRVVAETLTPPRMPSNMEDEAEKLAEQMGMSLDTLRTLKPLSDRQRRLWRSLSET